MSELKECPSCGGGNHANYADECGVLFIIHHKDECPLNGKINSISKPWEYNLFKDWNNGDIKF